MPPLGRLLWYTRKGKPQRSPCFALKCMQGHISPLSLQLGWSPSISLSLQQCQQGSTRKTRQEPSRPASSSSTGRAEGPGSSCPQQERWGPGNSSGFNVQFRPCILDKCKHNPRAKGTAWNSTELGVSLSMDSGYEFSHDQTTVNKQYESGRCCVSTRARIVSMAQGHRYLCAELNRQRRQKGARLGGVAATWRATCFALRPREQSRSCSGQRAGCPVPRRQQEDVAGPRALDNLRREAE